MVKIPKSFIYLTFGAICSLSGQTVINTANSGNGAFRCSVSTPFGTPDFDNSTVGVNANSWGWKNNGTDSQWVQMVHFDVTGAESEIADSDNNIILTLSNVASYGTGTEAELYLALVSSVEVTGDAQGNFILREDAGGLGGALPTTGTLIASNITATGELSFDVSDALRAQDISTNKFVYFRLQISSPTSNPQSGLDLGAAELDASVLTIDEKPSFTIGSANGGGGGFRVAINDPFGTPTFSNGSASLAGNIWGWKNDGANQIFSMLVHFDITEQAGFEAALSDSGNRVILTLDEVRSNFSSNESGRVYFAGASSSTVTTSGGSNFILRETTNPGGGGGLAIPEHGTLVADGILGITPENENNRIEIDVTDALQGLDLSTKKYLYFRLETTGPNTSPGPSANNVGTASLDASTLSVGPAPAPRPNILFVMADDWGGPHAGAYGTPWVDTPNFDSLAANGVLFNNAFVNVPSCTPARAVALSGREMWRLGSTTTLWSTMPASLKTFMDILDGVGYKVGFTGKGWGPGDLTAGGRDATFTPAGPEYNEVTLSAAERAAISSGLDRFNYAVNFDQFLSQRYTDDPFVFWYGPQEPHRPYEEGSGEAKGGLDPADVVVPAYWPDTADVRTDMTDYVWELKHMDNQIGLAIASLAAKGELANTIIIVTGDHGMPFPRVKTNLYEDGVNVPFVVRWDDGIAHTGRTVDDLISFVDIAPTLLDLTGTEKPADVTHDGGSIRDLLESSSSGTLTPTERKYVYLGIERHAPGTRDGLDGAGYPSRGVRSAQYLYIRNYEPTWDPPGAEVSPTTSEVIRLNGGTPAEQAIYDLTYAPRPAEELYDIISDPECMVNLASDPNHAVAKATLSSQLEMRQSETNDPRYLGYGDSFFAYPYYRDGAESFSGWENETSTALEAEGSDGVALMTRIHLGVDDSSFTEAAYSLQSDNDGIYIRYRVDTTLPEFSSTAQWTSDLSNSFSTSGLDITPVETEGNFQWYEARPSSPVADAFFSIETTFEQNFQ